MKKITVNAGGLLIGGENPVSVQSMTNTATSDVDATVRQINALKAAGAELVRVSVPDEASARAIKEIKNQTDIPIAVDIHFQYKLAMMSDGADKVRINPGNIGGEKNVAVLAAYLKERKIPVRIGVNAGSLEAEFKHLPTPQAMVESVLRHVRMLERENFFDIVLSVKASSVKDTVAAYRLLNEKTDYPLHIGLTEAGFESEALIRSSAAMGALLLDGIGDTVRYSLAGDPVKEVAAAKVLLNSLDLRRDMIEIVACPTCARTEIPVEDIARSLRVRLAGLSGALKIAVMGCVVNGIGEGEGADIGVAGGRDKSVIFAGGKKLETVENPLIEPKLFELASKLLADKTYIPVRMRNGVK